MNWKKEPNPAVTPTMTFYSLCYFWSVIFFPGHGLLLAGLLMLKLVKPCIPPGAVGRDARFDFAARPLISGLRLSDVVCRVRIAVAP